MRVHLLNCQRNSLICTNEINWKRKNSTRRDTISRKIHIYLFHAEKKSSWLSFVWFLDHQARVSSGLNTSSSSDCRELHSPNYPCFMPPRVSKEYITWGLTVDVALLDDVYYCTVDYNFCQVIEARGGCNRRGAKMARWEALGANGLHRYLP